MVHLRLIFVLVISCGLCGWPAYGQQWTRFRGPNGCGNSDATTIPATWTDADYRWRVELAGSGHSSPVVWGDRVYVTAANSGAPARIVQCLRVSDGSEVWRKEFASTAFKQNGFNSYAAMTPPVDQQRLYLTWTTPDSYIVVALDRHNGTEVWRRDLGPFGGEHGSGASPVLFGDLLIVPNDQDGKSFVIALDCATGETRWKTDRRSQKASYSTPCFFQPPGGKPQLILTSWAYGISSLDPVDGKSNWDLPVFEKRTVGSPLVADGLIIAGCGEGGGGKRFVAVTPGEPSRGIEPKLAYEFQGSLPYVPVPVAYGKLIFLWSDSGVVTCCDLPTGQVRWRERVGGKYFSSPVRVADRLYCPSRDGEMVVLAAAPEYKLLAKVPLGEGSHATPAIADGIMYIRTFSHLMALGGNRAP